MAHHKHLSHLLLLLALLLYSSSAVKSPIEVLGFEAWEEPTAEEIK